MNLDTILKTVEKPSRYIGNEYNSVHKSLDNINIRFGFCFADVYEIGMSHLGMKILYHLLNTAEDIYCERFFAPWVDMEEQMRQNSDEVIIMTDDGSYGTKGLVTNGVEAVINREPVNLCVTIGPAIMMKFVSLLTKKYEVPTIASLNTIMVDGTGMCGACRVTVGGKTKFVCVDGPEFDAHQVDFDEMMMRLGAYKDVEKK